jgi:hypothetical protein
VENTRPSILIWNSIGLGSEKNLLTLISATRKSTIPGSTQKRKNKNFTTKNWKNKNSQNKNKSKNLHLWLNPKMKNTMTQRKYRLNFSMKQSHKETLKSVMSKKVKK